MTETGKPAGPALLRKTMPQMLRQAAATWPDHIAILEDGESLTYQDLLAQASEVAAGFVSAGLDKGDRFAIWAPNCREWIVTALGGLMAGCVLIPINTRFKGSEAADILGRGGVKALFTVKGFLGADYPAMLDGYDLPTLDLTVLLRGDNGASWAGFIDSVIDEDRVRAHEREAALRPEDVADILFTSGTTGQPKGAMTAHGQNVAVFDEWASLISLHDQDRYLIVNPFFHSFGYKAGWFACLLKGATALPHAVFDVDQILDRIAADKVTVLPGPPTIFQSLINHAGLAGADISSLRATVTGAASIPVHLVEQMKQVLGFDIVLTAYGLTEATGTVTMCRPEDDFETIANTSGRAIPFVEVKCVDGQGNAVPADEAGEVLIRGYNVMQGYLDNQAATDDAITDDGWLRTGDIGILDAHGYLRITDRAKDMFITGGFNCYPAEIENTLLRHDAVADAAVISAPDDRMGEVAHAFIVLKAGQVLEANELIGWARHEMANYKVPRLVSFVDELPRNASGKVQKFKLRDLAA
ncbi:MAG: FadD3 family acyl-CoA ligase [Alphaproteobacteria bacterium]